jgi:thiamine monophosphate kinase
MQVNRCIIEMAHAFYERDWCVNKHAGSLQAAANVSDINAKGWDPLKVAALEDSLS